MKLLAGAIAYLAVVILFVALGVGAASYAIAPPHAPEPISNDEAALAETTAVGSPEEEPAPEDPNRVPVWIAPTAKYLESAFEVGNAARAKQAARSRPVIESSRKKERQRSRERPRTTGEEEVSASSSRAYEEPIQFRERVEPR